MIKNVIIIDEKGNVIGETYPKRADGFVRNGRAEYVGEGRIMMKDGTSLTVAEQDDEYGNDFNGDVIGFDARDFSNDPTCQGNNVATRMFVTDPLGGNVEIYEIGDNGNNWTQISCEMQLEKNHDYCFKFALVTKGYSPLKDYKSQFMVMPLHDGEEADRDWDNRYVYDLTPGQYAPIAEKSFGEDAFRIFDVPFNTGDTDRVRFVFLAFRLPARIYPVMDVRAYSGMEDAYIIKKNMSENGGPFYGLGNEFLKFLRDFIIKTVKSVVAGFLGSQQQNALPGDGSRGAMYSLEAGKTLKRSNCRIEGNEFSSNLSMLTEGMECIYSNCSINDSNNFTDTGMSVEKCRFNLSNTKIDGECFCRMLDKAGAESEIRLANTAIGECSYETAMSVCETFRGCRLRISNCRIASTSAAFLFSKIGDDCVVEVNNVRILEGEAFPYGYQFVRTKLSLVNTKMDNRFAQAIDSRIGNYCSIKRN